MTFGSIPPGMERPFSFGYELRSQIKARATYAQKIKLGALQNQYKVYKSLGSLGEKGLASVAKRADRLARQTMSPLEYRQSLGSRIGSGLSTFKIDV